MLCAYIIATIKVHDAEKYEEYKRLANIAIKLHGAEFLVRGSKAQALEGNWAPARMVLLKFPSLEAAHAFNDSPEYALARQARRGIAEMEMTVVEGL